MTTEQAILCIIFEEFSEPDEICLKPQCPFHTVLRKHVVGNPGKMVHSALRLNVPLMNMKTSDHLCHCISP